MKKYHFVIIMSQKETNLRIGILHLILGYEERINLINPKEIKNMNNEKTQSNGLIDYLELPKKKTNDQQSSLIKLIFAKFNAIWGQRWATFINETNFDIALFEWSEGLNGITRKAIKEALSYCRDNLEWPPSIAEFRRICLQSQGLPSTYEIMQLAIQRDFNQPIVKHIFDKIGSWAFSHDSESELNKKIEKELNNLSKNNKLFLIEKSC